MSGFHTIRFSTYEDLDSYRRNMRLLTGDPKYTDGLIDLYERILSRQDPKTLKGTIRDFYVLKIKELFEPSPQESSTAPSRERKTSKTTKKSPQASKEKETEVLAPVDDWEALELPSASRARDTTEAKREAQKFLEEYVGWIEEVAIDGSRRANYEDFLTVTRQLLQNLAAILPKGVSLEDVPLIDYILGVLEEEGWDETTLSFRDGEPRFDEIMNNFYEKIELTDEEDEN